MIYLLLFFNIFLVYLYTLFPTIAAYRDSGELSVVGYLLGIAHPPGYPLYSLLLHIFGKILPFGNYAYRFNIFSAVVSGIASLLLFHIYNVLVNRLNVFTNNKLIRNLIGYLICLIFSLGYLQWYLSLVSEMYTLNMLFAMSVILLCSSYFLLEKKWIYLTFFLFFLGLTNRLDLLLFFPILGFIFFDYIKHTKEKIKIFLILTFLSFIGLSCYLYLPIRSLQNPFIDWNNPEELPKFWASLTRKTHGSTLDLISAGYKTGENFFDGLKLYFTHLLNNVSLLGIFFIFFGVLKSVKVNKLYSMSLLFSWFLSCLYFIYKANMPPNPHALAILEAHFLLPNTIVFVWFILGVLYMLKRINGLGIKFLILVFLFILIIANIKTNVTKLNKRNNFYAYDYATNVIRTVPDNSIVIVKEDIQIFSCWYKKFVENFRPSIYIIAAGLSGSSWYWQMCNNYFKRKYIEPIFITNTSDIMSFEQLVENNRSHYIFLTPDVEPVISDKYDFVPYGMLLAVVDKKTGVNFDVLKVAKMLYKEIYILRGKYNYDLDWEFFSSDLIEDYSKSLLNIAHWLMKNGYIDNETFMFYKTAEYMNPDYPFISFELGYSYFKRRELPQSEFWYSWAVDKFEEYLLKAKKYKANADVVEDIKKQVANAYLHLGVVLEKTNKLDQAIENYNKALGFNMYLPEAYYNLAVVYWKLKDWQKVIYYLKETLKLNPNHYEARFYLEKALQMHQ